MIPQAARLRSLALFATCLLLAAAAATADERDPYRSQSQSSLSRRRPYHSQSQDSSPDHLPYHSQSQDSSPEQRSYHSQSQDSSPEHIPYRRQSETSSSEHARQYDDFDSDEERQPYAFQYEVDAPYHGTWHDRQEKSSGRKTEGQFRVALPDHRLQTVTYQATHKKGFQADVQFEQHPDFNSLRGNIGKAPTIGASVVSAYKPVSKPESISYKKPSTSKPHESTYGHQISAGTKYGSRRPRPSKSSTVTRTKITRRPISLTHSDVFFRPTGGSRKKITSRPPSYNEPHKISTPLAAFVSIASLTKEPTFKPFHVARPVTHSPFSEYVPSPVTVTKKVVPSRPLRTKQRTTFKPSPAYVETVVPHHFTIKQTSRPSYGDKKISKPVRRPRPVPTTKGSGKDSSSPPPKNSIPKDVSVSHVPKKEEPQENMEPPATTDESFSVAGKETRYAIRKEGMNSIRSRLNSIVHD